MAMTPPRCGTCQHLVALHVEGRCVLAGCDCGHFTQVPKDGEALSLPSTVGVNDAERIKQTDELHQSFDTDEETV